jgi:hypothetical protein
MEKSDFLVLLENRYEEIIKAWQGDAPTFVNKQQKDSIRKDVCVCVLSDMIVDLMKVEGITPALWSRAKARVDRLISDTPLKADNQNTSSLSSKQNPIS